MQCAEMLRVQAYFDGEIDAVSAADIEMHTAHCAECRKMLQDLQQTRTAIRREIARDPAPPELRARILAALDEETPTATAGAQVAGASVTGRQLPRREQSTWRTRPFWIGALSGLGAAAAAAVCAFFVFTTSLTSPLLDSLVAAHVHSLMSSHLIDVVSTDRHTVKPWFAGHTDVSPVVADFTRQGYRLIGGRVDYFDNGRSAVVVYQHGRHVINVFNWATAQRTLPTSVTRNGYHVACWTAGNLQSCAVSDTSWDELQALVRLLRDLGEQDAAPGRP